MDGTFLIDPGNARPIYLQIMDEVRRALVMGTLSSDEPLPSVRQMSIDLHVNPNTVRKAYRELEHEGLVYMRRGEGTFVSPDALPERERRSLSHQVARRALREAHRHGLSQKELKQAIDEIGGETGLLPDGDTRTEETP
ncbi:GntR family transcriptional regulator [Gemmatimonadota bacterium]